MTRFGGWRAARRPWPEDMGLFCGGLLLVSRFRGGPCPWLGRTAQRGSLSLLTVLKHAGKYGLPIRRAQRANRSQRNHLEGSDERLAPRLGDRNVKGFSRSDLKWPVDFDHNPAGREVARRPGHVLAGAGIVDFARPCSPKARPGTSIRLKMLVVRDEHTRHYRQANPATFDRIRI